MRYILLITMILMLSACATTKKLETKLASRVGMNVNDLINEIGPPQSSFSKPNGEMIYTWVNERNSTISQSGPFPSSFNNSLEVERNFCNISYTADKEGIIKSWYHYGNICRIR